MVLTFADYTIQTSSNFFIVFLIFFIAAVYLLLRLISRFISLPKKIEKRRRRNRIEQSERLLTEGLIASQEGQWHKAELILKKGAQYSSAPSINYLAAAQVAQEMGQVEQRDHYLRLAHEHGDDNSPAIGVSQARMQLEQEQNELALATLKSLRQQFPQHQEIKRLLMECYYRVREWSGVIELLPDIKKQRLMSGEKMKSMELQAYAGLMRNADSVRSLAAVWLRIPRKLRLELFLIDTYVREHIRFNEFADCESMLRRTIKMHWDRELVRLYGLVEGSNLNDQLKVAEGWLKKHPHDPVLLLTLGRLAIRNSLWGKARDYLKESLNISPQPEVLRELAQLLEQMGESKEAALCYQQGLLLATEPDDNSAPVMLAKPR